MADAPQHAPEEQETKVRGQGDAEEAGQEDWADEVADSLPAEVLAGDTTNQAQGDVREDVHTGCKT